MPVKKEKLHIIDKNGIERTYRLFSNANDVNIGNNLCVNTPSGVGYCPVSLGGFNVSVPDEVNVIYKKVDNLTYVGFLVNIESSSLYYYSTSNIVAGPYSATTYKHITRIGKNVALDYDLIIVFYNGYGSELWRTTLSKDVKSINVDVTMASESGFFWSAFAPNVYEYRTLEFNESGINFYIQGAALAYVSTPPFSAIIKDYDGRRLNANIEWLVEDRITILPIASWERTSHKTAINDYPGGDLYYLGSHATHAITLKISYNNVELVVRRQEWQLGGFGNFYFDLPSIKFDERKTAGETWLFNKKSAADDNGAENISLTPYE